MIDKLYLKIVCDEDIEKLNVEADSKVNHLHLEIQKCLDDKNMKMLFEKLNHIEPYNRFHLDLKNCQVNDIMINLLDKLISKWKLREINYNLTNGIFTDEQFKSLIYNALISSLHKENIEKLHLIFENSSINSTKLKIIKNTLNSLPKLSHIYINIKNNTVRMEDVNELALCTQKFYFREIHF